ncbi:MAG: hypothetical protein ABFR82_10855 [Nitrospirota bacterium]
MNISVINETLKEDEMKRVISYIKLFRKKLGTVQLNPDCSMHNNAQKDAARIQISSKLLQLSEFRLFQLAYYRWYGRELPERNMENIFAGYMFKNEVPHWVRHFSRKVLSLYFAGKLDPQEFGLDCAIPEPRADISGRLSAVLLSFIYLFFYLILSGKIIFH